MKINFKIFIGLAALLILAVGVFEPQKARAIPVIDVAHIGKTIKQTIEDRIARIKDRAEKSLSDKLTKHLTDKMIQDIMTSIQGKGEPKYVTNWQSLNREAEEESKNFVMAQIGMSNPCPPINYMDEIFGDFKIEGDENPFETDFTDSWKMFDCNLDDTVNNLNLFYSGAVGTFTFDAYLTAWEPKNNDIGRSLVAADLYNKEKAEKSEAKKLEASAGRGFVSDKKCIERDQNYIQNCSLEFEVGGEAYKNCVENAPCLKTEITTPGSMTAAAADTAMTAEIQQIMNTKSLDGLQNALDTYLVTKTSAILDKGVESVARKAPPSSDKITEDTQKYFNRNKTSWAGETQKFVDTATNVLNVKNQSLAKEKELVSVLQRLANCGKDVAADLAAAQAKIVVLENETNNLTKQINEVSQLKQAILDAQNTTTGRQEMSDTYDSFNGDYLTDDGVNILSGQAQTDANDELQNIRRNLEDFQKEINRLLFC